MQRRVLPSQRHGVWLSSHRPRAGGRSIGGTQPKAPQGPVSTSVSSAAATAHYHSPVSSSISSLPITMMPLSPHTGFK